MAALRVERPTTLTRVSEYIPEIVTFVEGIVERGFAYEGGGSVWFDTAKFEGAEGKGEGDEAWRHTYAKLQPWSKGNRELLEDGEGASSSLSPLGALSLAARAAELTPCSPARRLAHLDDGQALGVRLCAVEVVQAGRAGVAVAMGPGPPRVAHRVLGHGDGRPRRGHGRPLGRRRPRVPTPRQRARAERGASLALSACALTLSRSDPQTEALAAPTPAGVPQLPPMGQLLPAHGSPAHRGPQDVQVAQELYHDRRRPREVLGAPAPVRLPPPELERPPRLQGELDAGGPQRRVFAERASRSLSSSFLPLADSS